MGAFELFSQLLKNTENTTFSEGGWQELGAKARVGTLKGTTDSRGVERTDGKLNEWNLVDEDKTWGMWVAAATEIFGIGLKTGKTFVRSVDRGALGIGGSGRNSG